MLRFLCFILGKPYETCKSCETLKQQLAFANEEKKQLTETLLNIISPKVVEAAPVEINQVAQSSGLFSRRRAALEARDRENAKIITEAKHLGKPDIPVKGLYELTPPSYTQEIAELEAKVGISEEKEA